MDFARQKIDLDIAWNFINNAKVTFNPDVSPWYLVLCNSKQKLNALRHHGTNWHKILYDLDKLSLTNYLREIIYSFLKAKATQKLIEYFRIKEPKVYEELRKEFYNSFYREGKEFLSEKPLDKDTLTFLYLTMTRKYEYE